MSSTGLGQGQRRALTAAFGDRIQRQAPLAQFTSARIGGPAEFLLSVDSAAELAEDVIKLWELEIPFRLLGGGSNVLIADEGVEGVVILNRARAVVFDEEGLAPTVRAESGASLGGLGRRAAERGLAGLEWAATVPGTVGGAVVGNAGAHGFDTAGCLQVAEILQQGRQVESWTPEQLQYGYRTSWLKRNPGQAVVLAASFRLERSSSETVRERMREFTDYRRQTQPTGASWGSMFKNPKGDYAGRLIEAAGLKGLRRGQAEVSQRHANFFVNHGGATAAEVWELLKEVHARVADESGVDLELEIELVGKWQEVNEIAAGRVGGLS